MLTLAIETSGLLGSIALFDRGQVLAEQNLELGRQHGQSLIPAIQDLLASCGKNARDCGLVAVSVGPGSFTGLRVGVVCAKTLAYAAGCRIAAVDTLPAIACNSPPGVGAVEVIADAQRGDLFAGRFVRGSDGVFSARQGIRIVAAEDWAAGLTPEDTVSGPALEKLAPLVERRCRVLASEFRVPSAAWIARLGTRAAEAGLESDLWSVEPLYLRRSSAEIQWEKLHPGR